MTRLQPPVDRASVYATVFALDRSAAVRMETAALATGLDFVLEWAEVKPDPFVPGGTEFLESSYVTALAYRGGRA